MAEVVQRHERPSSHTKDSFLSSRLRPFLQDLDIRHFLLSILDRFPHQDSLEKQLPFVQTQIFFLQDLDVRQLLLSILRRKKGSIRPDSDDRQHPFVKSQTKQSILSPGLRERHLPFVQTQTKESFLSSRLRSFLQDLDVRQLLSSTLRRKTASYRPDSEER